MLVPQKPGAEFRNKWENNEPTPTFFDQSPPHKDEMMTLRQENKVLKGQVKQLQQQIMLQVNEKETELNHLRGILSERCWLEENEEPDEDEERRDTVNDLRKVPFSPRNVNLV